MVDALRSVMLPHPQSGQLTQRPRLRKSDRLKRMAETKPTAALHLIKDQRDSLLAGLRGDNVDLPQPAAPIPLQDLHPLPLQLRTGQILTTYAPVAASTLLPASPTSKPKHAYTGQNRAGSPKSVE